MATDETLGALVEQAGAASDTAAARAARKEDLSVPRFSSALAHGKGASPEADTPAAPPAPPASPAHGPTNG